MQPRTTARGRCSSLRRSIPRWEPCTTRAERRAIPVSCAARSRVQGGPGHRPQDLPSASWERRRIQVLASTRLRCAWRRVLDYPGAWSKSVTRTRPSPNGQVIAAGHPSTVLTTFMPETSNCTIPQAHQSPRSFPVRHSAKPGLVLYRS